jgi:hypothetical protein
MRHYSQYGRMRDLYIKSADVWTADLTVTSNKQKEINYMTRTIEYLTNRIHKLTEKDFMMNKRIINKLQRQVRALEKKNESV